ncbi:peptidoglycan recognition protein-like isoform X1 [Colias croceus]|uniref:peptidoglycan recognition protein-like isoform X1 n=1 Tax=Colias crocea TaxID=72248 RepID=UPI001E27E63E|nr:peptidoglycan recognition protein-like isoform X1 [Colias croceus]
MWTERDNGNEAIACNGPGTANSVVLMDDRILAAASSSAAASTPQVSNLNVNKSSRVHIGPKFVSVTQNVQNAEMIKELSLPKYLWDVVKNSSRTERLSCAAALMVLITCITLIIYFTVQTTKSADLFIDKPPHEWRITREMWLAQPFNESAIAEHFNPLMLVVVQHTVSSPCTKFVICAAQLRNMQHYFIGTFNYDIPYNFLIGNDGRVYEGRGWNTEGAHTFGYNRCAVGIGFIGDYREDMPNHSRVTDAQLNRTRMILAEGVRLGYLRPDYLIVGAKDLRDTASPGSILYEAIREWPNYDHKNRFAGLTCEQMNDKFGNSSLAI